MKAFEKFRHQSHAFWGLVRFVSQELGYTNRRTKEIRVYSERDIKKLLKAKGYNAQDDVIRAVVEYAAARADYLNNTVKTNLMNIDTARSEYESLHAIWEADKYLCKIPMNKQSGKKKHELYLSAIVNILTEKTVRENGKFSGVKCFADDPNKYLCVVDQDNYIACAASRRMDGAYPDLASPKLVWEIKEYYGTTSFGSRVADGVYESQLDGYELEKIEDLTGRRIYHALIVDDYFTWWEKGRSYLCRLIDILNEGLVDEVLFGKEVLTRWPEIVKSVL